MGIPLHGRGTTRRCTIFYKRSARRFLAWSMLQSSSGKGSANNEFNGSFADTKDLFEYLEILLGRWVASLKVQVKNWPYVDFAVSFGGRKAAVCAAFKTAPKMTEYFAVAMKW